MAIGDIYKIVTNYSSISGVASNRWFYRQKSGSDTDSDLIHEAWLEDVYPSLQAIQVDNLALVGTVVTNLMNPTDFSEHVLTGYTGDITGVPASPFVTWRFRFSRGDRGFRPGRKSIAGVARNDVDSGEADAARIPDLNMAASAMGGNINPASATGNVFEPMLVREVVGLPPTEYTLITGCAYVEVSSQNTRKFNRGV